MKRLATIWSLVFACSFAVPMASAANVIKPVTLPSAEGKLLGAAFSHDSSRLAIIRNVVAQGAGQQRHVLQIIDVKSMQELTKADVLNDEPAEFAMSAHLIAYSSDGRYLLLATKGSDVLLIFDATTLQILKRLELHPEKDSRPGLGQGHRYFRGVVSLATSAKGNVFGVLTHDELQGNEAFIGSFTSGQINKGWNLGNGRAASQLGHISLSLSEDGSNAAVSLLPNENSLPKSFNNLRIYSSSTGVMVKAVQTNGLIGQVALLPDNSVLAARINTPGIFSKKVCIEKWNLNAGNLDKQFCDHGRNVSAALGAAHVAGRVAGFASQLHKTVEGQVYAARRQSRCLGFENRKSGGVIG